MDSIVIAKEEFNKKAKCCQSQSNFAGRCCVRSISWIIFFLMYIVPTVVQSVVLAHFSNDFPMVKLLLVAFSCLIMAATLYSGIRLVIDCRHGKYNKDRNDNKTWERKDCTCEHAYCTPLWKPKSLLMGTHWMHILYPWKICNIASVGYFGAKLINDGSNWIIALAFIPFAVFAIGGGIGFAISLWIDEYKEQKLARKKAKKNVKSSA